MPESDRFGPYMVFESLGAGGMATVHRAELELEGGGRRDVALKRLLPHLVDDKMFVDDFVREAKLAAHLRHPNIVRILELGRVGGRYFIAMELVRGTSLMALMRKAIARKQPVPIGVVLSLSIELCDALDYAHNGIDELGGKLHIVHRDLSPSNLLVTDDGHLKIIDFGVAKAVNSAKFQTSSGLAKGKLGYMSVEALGGKQLDARSDLFSVGVVMWELLAGRRLFKAKNEYDVITKIKSGEIQPPSQLNPDCPSELDEVVVRALARSRDDRWASASVMRQVLDTVRRYYSDHAQPRTVASWAQELRADAAMTSQRIRVESSTESTAHRLTTGDLEELLDEVDQPEYVPEGSRRDRTFDEVSQAYDDLHVSAGSQVSAPLTIEPSAGVVARDDATESSGPHATPKFKDADTVVSISKFFDNDP